MKENMSDFEIIDEQTDFVVVSKHENINFHDEDDLGQGLFNQVAHAIQCPKLYPVHRLDKMTSGLIIFAKTLATAQQFQQMFEKHEIAKFYLAISTHKPKKKQGLIKGDMQKSRRGMWKLMRTTNNPAITQFFSYGLGNGKRLFLLKPHSGKTHQLRVALNSIGATIYGDPLYSSNVSTSTQTQEILADRGYLHAFAITFVLHGQTYKYVCKPTRGHEFDSTGCKQHIDELARPWQLNWPNI
ncbi:TIGR01621 family pseudouridine synthase [Thalassotalea atypica]|uniref:TIGR01621 family pseudouridine synthase n=1 Tax=Thalassotalea atypica TaxID=2054316 RepID=UPI002572E03C|nr:TIGR01621 family pseudouridine synthase [Thalassotalea atypica]